MKKKLKKLMYIVGAAAFISGCNDTIKYNIENKEAIDLKYDSKNISIDCIQVLDCDAHEWYTNISSGAEAFYGKKIYIQDNVSNVLFDSTYYYRGIYPDEYAFLGDNYTSLQDENSMIHSYEKASLESLETFLLENGMEEYIKPSYTNEELIELNWLLNISAEISYNEQVLHK